MGDDVQPSCPGGMGCCLRASSTSIRIGGTTHAGHVPRRSSRARAACWRSATDMTFTGSGAAIPTAPRPSSCTEDLDRSCTPNQRRIFDPDLYDAMLFDQRGSGRVGRWRASPMPTEQQHHTASDRRHRGASRAPRHRKRWTVLGVSWGSNLGLAYAEAHPERIRALVLALATMTTQREVEWVHP